MPGLCPRQLPIVAGVLIAVVFSIQVTIADNNPVASTGPISHSGWTFRVAAENLPGIDNLVTDNAGALYATQELGKGAGKVIHINRGRTTTVIAGLDRADGLLRQGNILFVTEETFQGRILEFELTTKKMRTLAVLSKPEGIDMFPDGDLLVSEDIRRGRLVRVRRSGDKPVEVILADLKRPEGVLIRPDGTIIFAETASGRVLSYRNGTVTVVVEGLSEPDQVELAADGSLWITEDVRNGRLLRWHDGVLETVLSGLHYPQGMAFAAGGSVWLAEQGRQRILLIHSAGGT